MHTTAQIKSLWRLLEICARSWFGEVTSPYVVRNSFFCPWTLFWLIMLDFDGPKMVYAFFRTFFLPVRGDRLLSKNLPFVHVVPLWVLFAPVVLPSCSMSSSPSVCRMSSLMRGFYTIFALCFAPWLIFISCCLPSVLTTQITSRFYCLPLIKSSILLLACCDFPDLH